MCGIAGLLDIEGRGAPAGVIVGRMTAALTHRGPDDSGVVWGRPRPATLEGVGQRYVDFEAAHNVALGNTRLSILDTSHAGHQPLSDRTARSWIVYNGEVYNFAELRTELEKSGVSFRSRTDTEVVLQLYLRDGPGAFERLNGMFALGIWDGANQELILARDRYGVKPLYYARVPQGFVFASEIKALLGAGVEREVSLESLDRYIAFLWVPEPDTILAGVNKVKPGHWMRVKPGNHTTSAPFWKPRWRGAGYSEIDSGQASDELLARLEQAVTRQTVADVPVGAFLSGGLDSSLVVAMMLRGGHPPARVYTIGFDKADNRYERSGDDLRFARRLARGWGIPDEEIILRPEMLELLPKLIWALDEPLADPAIIPTYLVCQAARAETKVLLGGMGADEIFGGYRRHLSQAVVSRYVGVPRSIKSGLARVVGRLRSGGMSPLAPYIRRAQRFLRAAALAPADRYIDLCTWTDHDTRMDLFDESVREGVRDSDVAGRHREVLAEGAGLDEVDAMLDADTRLYLPSHNLNYTDKISMATSVEVRVPFLDNDLVDYAFRLPSTVKIRRLTGKYVLRQAAAGALPGYVRRRPKTGFAAPIRSWLTQELRGAVADGLSEETLRRRGLFSPPAVVRLLDEQRQGRRDWSYQLWALLTLELWMRAYLDGEVP